MAQLPPDGEILVQQIGGEVVMFDRYTEAEYVRFNPVDPQEFGPAMKTVWDHPTLTEEQKCFAVFWFGYFYAHGAL